MFLGDSGLENVKSICHLAVKLNCHLGLEEQTYSVEKKRDIWNCEPKSGKKSVAIWLYKIKAFVSPGIPNYNFFLPDVPFYLTLATLLKKPNVAVFRHEDCELRSHIEIATDSFYELHGHMVYLVQECRTQSSNKIPLVDHAIRLK